MRRERASVIEEFQAAVYSVLRLIAFLARPTVFVEFRNRFSPMEVAAMLRPWIHRIALLSFALAAATASAAPWFEETFDSLRNGPLRYQNGWTGLIDEITVVSSNSLSGKCAFLDADRSQLPIIVQSVDHPLAIPTTGRQSFSFAVKIDTTTPWNDRQASLDIMTNYMNTLSFDVEAKSVVMTAQHPLLDIPPATATWDLGTSTGASPDFTTGTYHLVEWVIEFDSATSPPAAHLVDARVDGATQASNFTRMPAILWIAPPNVRVSMTNGSTFEGVTPDAVFFDNLLGRRAVLAAARWTLY
jgi:hypothetical protein